MAVVVTSQRNKRTPKVSPVTIALSVALLAAIGYIAVGRGSGEDRAKPVDTPVARGAGAKEPQLPTTAATSANTAGDSNPPAGAEGGNGDSTTPKQVSAEVSAGEVQAAAESRKEPATPKKAEPPPMFDNPVETQIELVSRKTYSSLETPRVNLSHDKIMAYLKKPVEIYDDDDEKTIEAKERTAAMKADALEYIGQGGTLNQFLRDYAANAVDVRETGKDVREEVMRLLYEQGLDAAQRYLDEVNPQLKAQGYPEQTIGPMMIRSVERRKQREAAEAAKRQNQATKQL